MTTYAQFMKLAQAIDNMHDVYRQLDLHDSHNEAVVKRGLDQAIERAETALGRLKRHKDLAGQVRF